jgi:hypothetical protein
MGEDLVDILKSLHWHVVENTVNKEVIVRLAERAIAKGSSLQRALSAIIALDDELRIYGNSEVRAAMDEGRRVLRASTGEG